ncbi:MAG: hypothetical protein HW419_2895 [Deltaproteobacteria bacterium]|nr:hypothetical protein [Deltaproteobacteria bacterium]
MKNWSNGVMEYWAGIPKTHHCTTPTLQFPILLVVSVGIVRLA